MKLLRFLAYQSRHIAFAELVFRVEKLRNHYLERVFVRFYEKLDDDTSYVFSDELENVDVLAKREASRGQRVTQHVEFRVEALVGDAVEG